MEEKAKKPRKLSAHQQIIIRHVIDMRGCYDPASWGREGKLCATLIKKYGKEFLLWVSPPEGYKVNSLLFYFSVFGKNYLSDKLLEYSKQQIPSKSSEITLASTKIDNDAILPTPQPRTLKEFLEYGKTLAATGQSH